MTLISFQALFFLVHDPVEDPALHSIVLPFFLNLLKPGRVHYSWFHDSCIFEKFQDRRMCCNVDLSEFFLMLKFWLCIFYRKTTEVFCPLHQIRVHIMYVYPFIGDISFDYLIR